MTTEMFGTPLGFRTYDEDQAKLANLGANTEHTRALTSLNKAQEGAITRKAAIEARTLEALQAGGVTGGGPGGPGSPGSPPTFDQLTGQLQRAAGILASTGQLDGARKIVGTLSQIQQRAAQQEASQAAAASHELADNIKKLRLSQEVFSTVNSPATHAAAVLALQSNPLTADDSLPPSLQNYDPRAISAFLAGSPAAIKKQELKLKEIDEGRKQADSDSRRSVDVVRKDVMQRRVAVTEEREQRLTKAGGGVDKGVGSPTGSEVTAMAQELKRQGLSAGADTKGIQAQTLAEEARMLVKRNPGLSMSEARARVIAESAGRGELETHTFGQDKFAPQTGSLSQPHALPKTVAGLKAGQYYRSSDGSIAKFTGKGFEKMTAPARVPKMAAAAGPLDEEDDDGEEE